jgi:ATP-binding cassette subfamily B protein
MKKLAQALPTWGSAAIDPRFDRSPDSDEHTFWSVMRIMLRSWPFIRPQLFTHDGDGGPPAADWMRAASRGLSSLVALLTAGHVRARHLWVPGHLLYYLLLVQVQRAIGIVSGALTIDVLNQVLLQGEPMTELQAWLLGLDLQSYVGVEALAADQRLHVLSLYIVVMVLLWFVNLPFTTFLPYYFGWVMQAINQDLRAALVVRWNRLSMRYHQGAAVGDSIYRIYQDSAMVTAIIARFINAGIQLVSAVVCVFFVFFFDPVLSLLCLVSVLPVLGWGRWFSPRMRTAARVSRESNAALTSAIQETFSGIRVVKAFRAEEREQERFERASANAFNAQYRTRSLVVIVAMVTFTITALLLLGAEYLMALWANAQEPTWASEWMGLIGVSFALWTLGAFQWVKAQMFDFATDTRGVTEIWCHSQDIAMGLERVFDILDMPPGVPESPDARPFAAPREAVRFERVAFGYDPERPILRDVSFTARPGTITAIVGPTGSGKSTLMALLLRLFDPDSGRILVDDADLRELSVDSLRAGISIALQENLLFALSVTDNIRYVRPQASEEEVRAAARVACADDFVTALPEGYGTVLGDRGATLSTGQKQRLSIARAIAKDAPILVLDEPTAALDPETERRVLGNLSKWGQGRIVFLITHRVSTIRLCDQILYLDGGEIIEAGSHDDLMAMPDGRYRRFVDTDAGVAKEARR